MKEIIHACEHKYEKSDGQHTGCNQHCPASRMQGFHNSKFRIFGFFKVSSEIVHEVDSIINGKADGYVTYQHGE